MHGGGYFSNLEYEINKNLQKTNIKEEKSEQIPNSKNPKSFHSSSLTMLKDNYLLITYFAGSKEGAKDVKIYANLKDNEKISDAFVLLDRQKLMSDTKEYIKKLGNPVLVTCSDKIHLFVVGVSFGGWANSKIYHYVSDINIINLKFKQSLNLSPYLNISHLVKNNAINISFSDKHGFILPIYHELLNKYSLALVFDESGELLKINKITNKNGLFQPSVVALDNSKILFAFRADKKANNDLYTLTCDKYFKCGDLVKSNLKNYDNSVALFNANNKIYLIYNSDLTGLRNTLSLALMDKNSNFTKLYDIDKGDEMSYASVVNDDNSFYISYTHNRDFINLKQYLLKD